MILHLVQPVRHRARQVRDGVLHCCAGVGEKAFVAPVMESVSKIFGNFRILQPSMPDERGTANTAKMIRAHRAAKSAGEVKVSVQLIDDKLLHVDAFPCGIANDP